MKWLFLVIVSKAFSLKVGVMRNSSAPRGTGNTAHCPFYNVDKAACGSENVLLDKSNYFDSFLKEFLERGSMLWMVGDSVSAQYFDEVACRAWAAGATVTEMPVSSSIQSSWNSCRSVRRSTLSFKMCFVQAGTQYSKDGSVLKTVRKLDHLGQFHTGDVLVINEGVWFRNRLERESEHLQEISRVEALKVGNLQKRGVRVFWRETLATHFPTPHGDVNGWWRIGRDANKSSPRECQPVESPELLATTNSKINKILTAKNISIIPGFEVSLHARTVADHLGHKTPTTRRWMDCVHLCEPSASLAEATGLLFKTIQLSLAS